MVRVPAPKRADLCNVMFNLTFIYLLYQSIISSEIFLIFFLFPSFSGVGSPQTCTIITLASDLTQQSEECIATEKAKEAEHQVSSAERAAYEVRKNNGKKSVIEEGVLRVRVALRRHSLNAQCPHLPLMTSYTYIIQTHLFRTLIYFFLL